MDYQYKEQMNNLIRKIRRVLEEYGVKLAVLYGSVAINRAGPLSDIDIAIIPSDEIELELLICDLAKALSVLEDKIDVIIIDDELPYELLYNIFSDGILILGDKALFEELKVKYAEKYWDLKEFIRIHKLYDAYIEHLKERKKSWEH